MKPPLFVRSLSAQEQASVEQGLRSRDSLTMRRCQILLLSAKGERPSLIAAHLGCTAQTVRNTIREFHARGLACLQAQSTRPKTVQPTFDVVKREQLRALLHTNPRTLGQSRSTWTLELLSTVCHQRGMTKQPVSIETIRQALLAAGIDWKRAKNWITSPDPQYQLKKQQRQRLIQLCRRHPDWELGFLDQVWWSRLSQPQMHSWVEESPLRLYPHPADKTDPDPKAIACYGLWCKHAQQMHLRFVDGRPLSEITCAFLQWVLGQLAAAGKRVLALVWDNATWHLSGTGTAVD